MENITNEQKAPLDHFYYQVEYYNVDDLKTVVMLISNEDLEDFHRGKLDFLVGLVNDGERFSINGAMIYTILQVYC